MSWKKIESFKETEFGPMKMGHVIETAHCGSCDKLLMALEVAVNGLNDIADFKSDTIDKVALLHQADGYKKRADSAREQITRILREEK